MSDRCDACYKRIDAASEADKGAKLEAAGQTYHARCFACAECKTVLVPPAFVEYRTSVLCEACARYMCDACGKLAQESYVHNGKRFHAACFKCADCRATLVDGAFHKLDERAVCDKCFESAQRVKASKQRRDAEREATASGDAAAAGVAALRVADADACCECGDALAAGNDGGDVVRHGERRYHPKCFCCFHCKRALDASSFASHDGVPLCAYHVVGWKANERSAATFKPAAEAVRPLASPKHCVMCRDKVVPGESFVTVEGWRYHNKCFACYDCKKTLSTSGDFYRIGGTVVCATCRVGWTFRKETKENYDAENTPEKRRARERAERDEEAALEREQAERAASDAAWRKQQEDDERRARDAEATRLREKQAEREKREAEEAERARVAEQLAAERAEREAAYDRNSGSASKTPDDAALLRDLAEPGSFHKGDDGYLYAKARNIDAKEKIVFWRCPFCYTKYKRGTDEPFRGATEKVHQAAVRGAVQGNRIYVNSRLCDAEVGNTRPFVVMVDDSVPGFAELQAIEVPLPRI